jgi:hypothetical protein
VRIVLTFMANEQQGQHGTHPGTFRGQNGYKQTVGTLMQKSDDSSWLQ